MRKKWITRYLPVNPSSIVPVVILLASSSAVHGQLDYVDQSRSVWILAGNFGTPVEVSSTEVGVFNADIVDSFTDDQTGGFADAGASQLSDLNTQSITMSGEVLAFGSTDEIGTARSKLTAEFDLAFETKYSVEFDLFDLSLGGPQELFARTRLIDSVGAEVFSGSATGLTGAEDELSLLSKSGTLPAGRYTLEVAVSLSAFKDIFNSGSFGVSFVVPAPGSACFLFVGSLAIVRRRRD